MIRRVFFWTLVFALAGCAVNPLLPARSPAADISQFSFIGRLAVQQGETRHHVNVDWRHSLATDEILLTTPLGQGVAEIVRDAAGARLTLADRRTFEANDWSTLSRQVFGFPLPLRASSRWLLGDIADTEGWRVTIVARESAVADALPTVIELERDDIVVRLKIDEWIEVK
ncbi:MAG: outer membrane lipoprotein LolB [Rhodocyclaceae bacterium]|nr:outer membrane lipoprotein LolB [Rhodocyclaceae bacterium]